MNDSWVIVGIKNNISKNGAILHNESVSTPLNVLSYNAMVGIKGDPKQNLKVWNRKWLISRCLISFYIYVVFQASDITASWHLSLTQ